MEYVNKKLLAANNVVLHAFMSLWILIQLRIGTIQALSSKEHIVFLEAAVMPGCLRHKALQHWLVPGQQLAPWNCDEWAVLVKMTDFICMGFGFPPFSQNARGLGANHSRAMVRFSSCPDAQRLKSQAPPGESADEKPTTLQHWCSWCRQVQHFEPKKPSLVGHKWDQQQVKDFTGCCDNKPTGKKKGTPKRLQQYYSVRVWCGTRVPFKSLALEA